MHISIHISYSKFIIELCCNGNLIRQWKSGGRWTYDKNMQSLPLEVSDPVTYSNWKESHKCKYAYRGSAQGMEQAGTKTIFSRSIKKYGIRYTNLLGNGDTKSFSEVKDIYDGHPNPDVLVIIKKE